MDGPGRHSDAASKCGGAARCACVQPIRLKKAHPLSQAATEQPGCGSTHQLFPQTFQRAPQPMAMHRTCPCASSSSLVLAGNELCACLALNPALTIAPHPYFSCTLTRPCAPGCLTCTPTACLHLLHDMLPPSSSCAPPPSPLSRPVPRPVTFPRPCSVAASFGAGVLYSLSSGAKFDLGGAFATGLTFAAFNGLIYQVGGIAQGYA